MVASGNSSRTAISPLPFDCDEQGESSGISLWHYVSIIEDHPRTW